MSEKAFSSRSAKVTQDFADGTYDFRLGFGELEELDEKLQVGPMVLLNRLRAQEWRVGDVREIVRLGLIGGGQTPSRALQLVRRYIEDVPEWPRNSQLAFVILAAAISGFDVESPGKSRAGKKRQAPTAASASPPSTQPQP